MYFTCEEEDALGPLSAAKGRETWHSNELDASGAPRLSRSGVARELLTRAFRILPGTSKQNS